MLAVEKQRIVDDPTAQPLGVHPEEIVHRRHDDDAVSRFSEGEVSLVDGGDDTRAVGDPFLIDLPAVHLFFPLDDALVELFWCRGVAQHVTVQPFFQG